MFGEKEKKQKKVGKAESTESWRNVEDSVIRYMLSRDEGAIKPSQGQEGLANTYNAYSRCLRNQNQFRRQPEEPVFRNADKKKQSELVGNKKDAGMGTVKNRFKQIVLKDLGLYNGQIDGVWGPEAEVAGLIFRERYGYELEDALCDKDAANDIIPIMQRNRRVGRWIETVEQVAQWYKDNLKTYCSRTKEEHEEHGGLSTDGGRSGNKCGLEGHLKGQLVGDDCSSFLYACLVQAGFIQKNKNGTEVWGPNSQGYLKKNSGAQALRQAGFEWIPNTEFQTNALQAGDILVRESSASGHVEIFSHFDADGKEWAWTWGDIYDVQPVRKGHTKKTIWNYYAGVWRLK